MLTQCAVTCLLLVAPPQGTMQGSGARQAAPDTSEGTKNNRQGSSSRRQVKVITHDRILPPETLATMSMAPLDEHMTEIQKTGLHKLFAPMLEKLPQDTIGQLMGNTGITSDQLQAVVTQGWTVAWTGLSASNVPSWMLIANLGATTADIRKTLAASMLKFRVLGVSISKEIFLRNEVWILKMPQGGPTVTYTIASNTLLVSSDQKSLETAMTRLLKNEGDSLAHNKNYTRFCQRQARLGGTKPFFAVYLQPTTVVDQLLSTIPEMHRLRARQALGQMQLHKMQDLAFTLRAQRGMLHEFFWLTYPAPRSGLLAALLGSSQGVKNEVAEYVSPDAISAGVYHLNFRRVYDSTLALVGAFSHEAPQVIKMQSANLEARTGVSVTKDLLDMLHDTIVVQQWSVPRSQVSNVAVTIKLRDTWRFSNAMTQLVKMMSLEKYKVRGTVAYSVNIPGSQVGITPYVLVYRDHLVFATTDRALNKVLNNLDNPKGNKRFAEVLANLSVQPNSVSWANCPKLGREVLTALSTEIGDPLIAQDIAEVLVDIPGDLVSITRQTKDGFMAQSRSPYGNVYMTLAFALGCGSALQDVRGGKLGQDSTQSEAQKVGALLKRVVDAQKLFQASGARDNNKNRMGEYGTLNELIRAECLDRTLLGKDRGDGIFQVDKQLIKVLLPRRPANQEQHFAVIVWPDKRQRGLVYAITGDGLPQVNDIMAQAEGLSDCGPREIFLDGDFEKPLVEGWRPVATASQAARARIKAAKDARRQQGVEEQRQLKAVLLAEKQHRVSAESIRALQSKNPDIAARASYVMGSLKAKDAVPSLCQLASNHSDVMVRRQAMAALTKIRDTRSIATSVRALSDVDMTVRTFAATNLGRLSAKAGVMPLVSVLSTPAEGEAPDHTAALLALADIGDPRCLVPSATAVKKPGTKVAESLTYMFQKISPTLERKKEIQTLLVALDAECLMLRRYVIQRLGLLKDKSTIQALENRLAKEGRQLQPLITVSLDAIRGEENVTDSGSGAKLKATIQEWIQKGQAWWKSLTQQEQYIAMGGAGGVFLIFLLLLIMRSRRRRRRAAENWADMVNPSEEYIEDHAYDDYEGGDYAEGEYAEGEYVDGEYAEGEYAEGEYAEGEYADEYQDDNYDDGFIEMEPDSDDFAAYDEEEYYADDQAGSHR